MLSIGAYSYYSLQDEERQIRRDAMDRITLIARILRNGLNFSMVEGRTITEFEKYVHAIDRGEIDSIRIMRPDGSIIVANDGNEPVAVTDMNPFEGGKEVKEQRGNGTYLGVWLPITNKPLCMQCHHDGENTLGILSVSVSEQKLNKNIKIARKKALTSFVITLAALIASLYILSTYLLNRPIARIIETIRRVEAGDMDARFSVDRADELGTISTALNSMLTVIDSSKRKLEVYHLESIEKMQKMATIGELSASVAHEIKNPLAGISGAIQVLSEEFPPSDPKREVVSEILKEIGRLDKTVRDLISFARPPAPHTLPVPIETLMERITGNMQQEAMERSVSLTRNVEGSFNVIVDPDQIQQVFFNVLRHALTTVNPGGSIRITSRRGSEEGLAEIRVEDSGRGKSAEELHNIFKPFYTKQGSGGLGLAISKNIVEKHGGRITVESVPESGTTYHILLPLEGNNA